MSQEQGQRLLQDGGNIQSYGATAANQNARHRGLHRKTIICASMFALFGYMFGHFNSQIPVTKERLGVDDPRFGILLLFDDVGTFGAQIIANIIPSLLQLASLVPAFGVTVVSAAGIANLSITPRIFASSMLAFGLASSVFDIAINIQIVALGTASGKANAPFFHGLFSAGQLLGSGIGTLLTRLAVPFTKRIAGTAIALASIFALHFPLTYSSQSEGSGDDEIESAQLARDVTSENASQTSMTRTTITLALLGMMSSICEGALSEWAGVYLRQSLQTSFVIANWAAFAYSIGMTLARLAGTQAAKRFGVRVILFAGGCVTIFAMSIGLWSNNPIIFLAAVGVAAAGLANITPLTMSVVSKLTSSARQQAQIVTRITLAQQIGFFTGPVVIGALSGILDSLRLALITLIVCGFVICILSFLLTNDSDTSAQEEPR